LSSQFKRLTVENQRRLLERNTPLYIQLNLGIYLSQDQVKMENDPDEEASVTTTLPPRSQCFSTNFLKFIAVESKMKSFLPTANLDEYGLLVNQLRVLSDLKNPDQRAMLSYMILFNNDDFLLFIDNQGLEDTNMMNEIIFDSYVRTTDSSFELKDLSKILIQMALFCTYNIDWDTIEKMANVGIQNVNPAMSNLVMTYTIEEEAWLNNQFKLFEMAFRSVPSGQEIIHEFLMNSLGVPLSRNYMANVFRMMMERVRKVWCIHPEFEDLPVTVQRSLLRSHISIPHALYVVRCELMSGTEQLQEGLGVLDETYFKEQYLPVFDSPEKISQVSVKNLFIFTQAQSDTFSQLISSIRILVDNPNFFKLNFLYLLTQPQEGDEDAVDDNKGHNFLSSLHFKYKMILKRRLKCKQDWIPFAPDDLDLFVSNIFSCLEVVKEVADLNQQVASVDSH
jgi:hypothetical protein